MDFQTLVFFFLSAILIVASLRVITARNPVHAALHLILAFFTCGGIWALLQAEFLAIAIILVYVGAVMVLFLFVIMMLDIKEEERRRMKLFGVVTGLLSVGGLAALLVRTIHTSGIGNGLTPSLEGETRLLGQTLFSQYLLPFEIVSILLLVAMVGVILISKKDLK